MLRRLEIESFKAFGARQVASLAPITLIYGQNSSGKSALLQSMLFLKQSNAAGRLSFQGAEADLASCRHIAFRQEDSAEPVVSLSCDHHSGHTTNELTVTFRLKTSERFELDLRYRDHRCSLLVGSSRHEISFLTEDSSLECLSFLSAISGVAVSPALTRAFVQLPELFFVSGRGLLPEFTSAYESDIAWSMWSDDDESLNDVAVAEHELNDMLDAVKECDAEFATAWGRISGSFSDAVANVRHLGAVRPAPLRLAEPESRAYVSKKLKSFSLDENELLSKWTNYLGLPYRFDMHESGDAAIGCVVSTRVTDNRHGASLSLVDVGYGVSQVLPLLLEGCGQPGGDSHLVEQPELHLHPRQQGQLADFFLLSSGLCAEIPGAPLLPKRSLPVQWILETHSEALVTRMQRRIRQGLLQPDQISVIFVEPGPEGSRLIPLRLNKSGEFIDEWPGGFFEETYWDLFGGLH